MQHVPLVWSEASVCGGEGGLQLGGQLVQLSGVTGEAVELGVVIGLHG